MLKNTKEKKKFVAALIFVLLLIPFFGFGEFIFTNKEYREHIEIEWFLVPKELVCPIFNQTDPKLLKKKIHLKIGEINETDKQIIEYGYHGPAFLVILIKNKGTMTAWGDLKCDFKIVKNKTFNLSIYFGANPQIFVLPLQLALDTVPKVKFQWKNLYTKG